MAIYQIYQFGAAALPLYNPEQAIAPPAVASTLLRSVGATFDYAGTRRELPTSHEIRVRGIYQAATAYLVDHDGNQVVDHAGNAILVASALGYLRSQVAALTDQLGTSAALWRKRWDDETVTQWKTARLREVRLPHDYRRRTYLAEVEAVWQSTMAAWRAATATTVSASLVDDGAVGLLLTGGGDVTVQDATITVTASGTITSLAFVCGAAGISLTYTGTLSSGQTLTIDCGALTVRVGSTDSYQYFALGVDHTADGWLPLAPGVWPLVVASNGPGTVAVTHYNQFV